MFQLEPLQLSGSALSAVFLTTPATKAGASRSHSRAAMGRCQGELSALPRICLDQPFVLSYFPHRQYFNPITHNNLMIIITVFSVGATKQHDLFHIMDIMFYYVFNGSFNRINIFLIFS